MPIVEGIEQNTPEWLQMRIGIVTASRVADVQAFLKKGGESQKRRDYRYEIVTELLTGRSAEHYVTPAMEWGLEQEPLAKAAYEIKLAEEIRDGGFWLHDRISKFGASPDGLIGENGLIEVKCPTTSTHIEWMIAGVLPEDYQPQMLAQMACSGRKWCDFVSFDPRLPKPMQLFVRRFAADEARIGEMEKDVERFLDEVAETLTLLAQAREQELVAE